MWPQVKKFRQFEFFFDGNLNADIVKHQVQIAKTAAKEKGF